jgi:hypothetical protein
MKLFSRHILLVLAVAGSMAFSSCKKGEGEGGNSSITGKVWVKKYNPYTSSWTGEYAGAYQDVYIIYGDKESYGDRTETNPEGVFEFKWLRPGNYKVYTYSKTVDVPFNPSSPDKIIIKEVEITDKKQEVDAGTFDVNYYKL